MASLTGCGREPEVGTLVWFGREPRRREPTASEPGGHARESGHPIIRSAEPGEDWSWCYLDEVALVFEGEPR
jgi:hypothetical protein